MMIKKARSTDLTKNEIRQKTNAYFLSKEFYFLRVNLLMKNE